MDMEGMGKLAYNIGKLTIIGGKRWDDRRLNNAARALGAANPNAVVQGAIFNALHVNDRTRIVEDLLYRKAVPFATPLFPIGHQARNAWLTARAAYGELTPEEQDLADRYMILQDGLTQAQRLTSSDDYHRLNRLERDRVRRFLPGSRSFNRMRESVQRMVREKNDLKEETYQHLIKPILPTAVVRTFRPGLYSQYMTKFDPSKRYPYLPRFSPMETIRMGMWVTGQVRANFQKQMEAITAPPLPGRADRYKQIREWYVSIGGTIDNPANAPLVGQMVFSLEVIWNNLVMQLLRIKHDLYRAHEENMRDLRKHLKYSAGKNSSVYLNIFKERANKSLAAVTPLIVESLAYYELLNLGQ